MLMYGINICWTNLGFVHILVWQCFSCCWCPYFSEYRSI